MVDCLIITLLPTIAVCFSQDSNGIGSGGLPSTYATLDKCLLVLVPSTKSCDSNPNFTECADESSCPQHLEVIHDTFYNCNKVLVRYINDLNVSWIKKSVQKEINSSDTSCSVLIYKKPVLDRTCLTTALPSAPDAPSVLQLISPLSVEVVLSAINSICHTFLLSGGALSLQGYHHQYILNNLFSIHSLANSVTSQEAFTNGPPAKIIPECERVTISSWNQFFTDYLQISKPVIITGGLESWTAKSKWTNEFLRLKYGDERVHVKMSPTSDYEGIEPAEWWDNHQDFYIPHTVKVKLQFPDLVVPRPAPVNMNFSEFISLMEKIANGTISNASAYLEYSSIRNY